MVVRNLLRELNIEADEEIAFRESARSSEGAESIGCGAVSNRHAFTLHNLNSLGSDDFINCRNNVSAIECLDLNWLRQESLLQGDAVSVD